MFQQTYVAVDLFGLWNQQGEIKFSFFIECDCEALWVLVSVSTPHGKVLLLPPTW